MLFLFCFIVLGIMLNYAHFVIADGEENGSAQTGHLSADDNGNSVNGLNNSEDNFEDKDSNNVQDEDNETEYDFEDEQGNEVHIKIYHNKTKEGNLNIEEDDFEDENGNNISIINRNEINGNNGNGEFNNGEFEVNGVNAESEVELEQDFKNNKTEIKAKFGNKNETIKIMPDEASQTALKVLADKGFKLKIIAVGQGNEVKAVYSAELDQTGKIIGLFPVNLSSSALIDSQTGEVTDLNQPWWKFLVFGEHSTV